MIFRTKTGASQIAALVVLVIALAALLASGCSDESANESDASTGSDSATDLVSTDLDDIEFEAYPVDGLDGLDASKANVCTNADESDLSGTYLVELKTSLNANVPFLFQMILSVGEASYDAELQPLTHRDCSDLLNCTDDTARDVAGEAVTATSVSITDDGSLELLFEDVTLVSEANSLFGKLMNVGFSASIKPCEQELLCGSMKMVVNSLGGAPLDGSMAAVLTDDIRTAIRPYQCHYNPTNWATCGDGVCEGDETGENCPGECGSNEAGGHCATPFDLNALAYQIPLCRLPTEYALLVVTHGLGVATCENRACPDGELQPIFEHVETIFADSVEVSSACGQCYAKFVTCKMASCVSQCVDDTTNPECGTCLDGIDENEEAACMRDLAICTGLPEQYDPCE